MSWASWARSWGSAWADAWGASSPTSYQYPGEAGATALLLSTAYADAWLQSAVAVVVRLVTSLHEAVMLSAQQAAVALESPRDTWAVLFSSLAAHAEVAP